MRRRLLTVLLLALTSCVPINDRMVIDFDTHDRDLVRIVASTDIDPSTPRNGGVEQRLRVTRDAILAGRDEWSDRFSRVVRDTEQQSIEKRGGILTHYEHSATIATEALQRFVSDLPVTVQLTRGEGWSELTLYAGASTRATRQQREHFARQLEQWSGAVARYFQAVHHLYTYLGANPQRAENAFRQIYADDDQSVLAANEEERAAIVGVRKAIEPLVEWEDLDPKEAYTLAEEADLVLNPFPAEITIHTSGEITSVEGFTKSDPQRVAIPRPELLQAVAGLEGQWISPDPFAAALRADREGKKDVDTGALAKAERKSTALVAPSEIAKALVERMKPPSRYRVRWMEKG